MNALTRIICVIVSLWLAISALLPLFGYNLIASKPGLVAFAFLTGTCCICMSFDLLVLPPWCFMHSIS